MTEIHRQNTRIDDASQKMLSALVDEDKPVTALAQLAGLSWDQSDYRLRKLTDAGWVKQNDDSPKTYALTERGRDLVRQEGIDAPTLEDVRAIALDARTDAQSAKSSVQSYRRKVYEIREGLRGLEEDWNRLKDTRRVSTSDGYQPVSEHLDSLFADVRAVNDRLEQLEDETVTNDKFNKRSKSIAKDANAALEGCHRRLDDLEGQIDDLGDRLESIDNRLNELEAEQQQESLLSRLLPWS